MTNKQAANYLRRERYCTFPRTPQYRAFSRAVGALLQADTVEKDAMTVARAYEAYHKYLEVCRKPNRNQRDLMTLRVLAEILEKELPEELQAKEDAK